jgi:hypothetical protein
MIITSSGSRGQVVGAYFPVARLVRDRFCQCARVGLGHCEGRVRVLTTMTHITGTLAVAV